MKKLSLSSLTKVSFVRLGICNRYIDRTSRFKQCSMMMMMKHIIQVVLRVHHGGHASFIPAVALMWA